MFFANRMAGKDLRNCPSNDGHNVDAIDGLIMPTVVLLGYACKPEAEARAVAQQSVYATRNSERVANYVGRFSGMLRAVLDGSPVPNVAQEAAKSLLGHEMDISQSDPVVACYVDSNFASLIHLAAKYGNDFEATLLANANAGGENVHRGLVLGALMGAQVGASRIPQRLKEGLFHSSELEREIDAFVTARIACDHGAPPCA